MNRLISSSVVVCVVAIASTAGAQERSWTSRGLAAPSGAFELGLSAGYTQPLGQLAAGVGMPSVANAGVAAEVDVGWRALDPHWNFALGAQYQELTPERSTGTRGASGVLAATYHFTPDRRLDPWVELGAGYRFLWETHDAAGPTVLTHGIELARVRLGLDFRGAEQAAIGPFIGADATMFLWQDAGTSTAIADPRLSTFIFAGMQGRFDVGSERSGVTTTTASPYEP